ncbi:MAG: cytochrome c3 family protein [Deferrisomatales bacterium]|nr:cytochrome c3 family protein [Deferrisomatales bacterium]
MRKGKWLKLVMVGLLAAPLALMGCADDGSDGRPGADGRDGQDGRDAPVVAVETCFVCHDPGRSADLLDRHAVTGEVSYTVVAEPAADGDDVIVSFNILVDGVPDDAFVRVTRATIFQGVDGVYTRYDFRDGATIDTITDGVYALRIAPVVADPPMPNPAEFVGTDSRYYFRLQTGVGVTPARRASVSADDAAYVRPALASKQACINCHGTFTALDSHHFNPFDVDNCVACHSAVNPSDDLSLVYLAHGIHNSHNMPSGHFVIGEDEWSVTYPTYMQNCSVCHDTDAGLAAATDTPPTFDLCMSCHEDWTGFGDSDFSGFNHAAFTAETNCVGCHDGTVSQKTTAADFHNGLFTGRNGLIWDGMDQSVEQGKAIAMEITEVAAAGSEGALSVTWRAYNPITDEAYDACNTDFALGPVFFGATADSEPGVIAAGLSILRAYAQGDDWVNTDVGTVPGQPAGTVAVTADTTTCVGGVATTVGTLNATTATRARVAIQGRPQVRFEPAGQVILVRSPAPTYDFLVADGAPAAARRQIADTTKCLACHSGSLYNHSSTGTGSRIDNVELCVMCHNAASNEKNVREGYGVSAAEAYDGKTGETYDLRYMLHAIHSAGETGAPYVLYRNFGNVNGIFAWAKDESALGPNWPGTGLQTVFGSDPAAQRNHNFHAPTYPQFLNNCQACHFPGAYLVPDQGMAVALTVEAGEAPYGNQLDDTLMGPAAASCMSCHQSDNQADQTGLRAHAFQNGWVPTVFPNGREDVLNP